MISQTRKVLLSTAKFHSVKGVSEMKKNELCERLNQQGIYYDIYGNRIMSSKSNSNFQKKRTFCQYRSIYIPSYISGPHTYDHYKVKEKNILIFGDIHEDLEFLCLPCQTETDKNADFSRKEDCFTLSSWIRMILQQLKNRNLVLDLYVEDNINRIKNKEIYPHIEINKQDGRLNEIIYIYGRDPSKSLRYHHVDMRYFFNRTFRDEWNFYGKMMTNFESFYQNGEDSLPKNKKFKNTLKELFVDLFPIFFEIYENYTYICATSKDFKNDLVDFLNEWRTLLEENDKPHRIRFDIHLLLNYLQNTLEFAKKYNRMTLHPIGKQYRKLFDQEEIPKEEQDQQLENQVQFIFQYSSLNGNIFPHEMPNHYYQTILQYYDNHNFLNVREFMYDTLSFLNQYMMDMYSIPRILYQESNCAFKIYTCGSTHSKVLCAFLDYFYPNSNQLLKNKYSCLIKSNDLRCMNIGSLYQDVSCIE